MQRIIITNQHHELSYEYRLNRQLLIMSTTISDQRLTQLADELPQASQVELVKNMQRYDSGLAALVVQLIVGYDRETADREIKNCFDKLFEPWPTTV